MSDSGAAGSDLLEGGGPERPGRFAGDPGRPSRGLRGYLQRHRRATAVAALGLAALVWQSVRWYGERPLPTPNVQVSKDRSAESEPLWSTGRDGRPGSPVTLSVATQLWAPDPHPGDPEVSAVGLAGPGLSSPGVFPHRALGRRPADYDLTGQVACDQVPLPLPAAAYQVQLELSDGSRTTPATVPLLAAEDAVSRRVTYGCSTWLAARDLTMTAVRAQVDPERPHASLTVTVTNRGERDGLVWLGSLGDTGVRTTPVQKVVPAHRAVTFVLDVDLDRCPSWSQTGRPLTATDTPVPLLSAVGVTRPFPADDVPLSQGPIGLVLAPAVGEQLHQALVEACGGVDSPVLLTEPGSSRYDARTRVLTTKVLVDLPPGVVGSVRFAAAPDPGSGIVPLFTSSPWLVPDHTGQASWLVSFTVPKEVICLPGGPWVTLDAALRIPASDGTVRPATFRLFAETFLPEREQEAACSRPGG